MRDYLRSIALMAALFAILAAATAATSHTQATLDMARDSARTFCGSAAPGSIAVAACRTLARLRGPRPGQRVMRS